MKRYLKHICYCFAGSLIIVFLLFAYTTLKGSAKNGFKRTESILILKLCAKTDILYNSYYIAGFHGQQIFLGNSVSPKYLAIIDTGFTIRKQFKISFSTNHQIAWSSMKVMVNYPEYDLVEGSTNSHFFGKLPDIIAKEDSRPPMKFDKCVVLGSRKMIFRTADHTLQQYVLKKSIPYAKDLTARKYLLKRQSEGFFSTDGILLYDTNCKKIVYLYYYKNDFTVLDTNLNLLLNGKTIDTVKHAKIVVTDIKSEGTTTLAIPPKIINSQGTVYNNKLYVWSKLKADNETHSHFKNNFVIDIYNLENSKYIKSIYVPKYGYKRMTDFKVYQNILLVQYENWMYKFNLTQELVQ